VASANFYLNSIFIGSTQDKGSPEDILADPVVAEALTEEFKSDNPDLQAALQKGKILNGTQTEELEEAHFVYDFKTQPQPGSRYQVDFYDLDN